MYYREEIHIKYKYTHGGTNAYTNTAGNWNIEYSLISWAECVLLGHVWN